MKKLQYLSKVLNEQRELIASVTRRENERHNCKLLVDSWWRWSCSEDRKSRRIDGDWEQRFAESGFKVCGPDGCGARVQSRSRSWVRGKFL
jgi:hypothetical protein